MPDKDERDLAVNRRAYHDYFIDEKYEAGMMLTGTEVKSIRNGRANTRNALTRSGVKPRRDTYVQPGTGDPEGVLPDRAFVAGQERDFLSGLDFLVMGDCLVAKDPARLAEIATREAGALELVAR